MTSHLTTHVLDAALGVPAAGVAVLLSTPQGVAIDQGVTGADGRVNDLGPEVLDPGTYLLTFAVGVYFAATGRDTLYPVVTITFAVTEGNDHYHVPLLLSPYAYSTYRGS